MRRWAKSLVLTIALITLTASPFLYPRSTYAAGTCTVDINPTNITADTVGNFSVHVTNSGGQVEQWVDISVPNGFVYAGNSVSSGDWSSTDHGNGSTFTNGVIGSGQSYDFAIAAQAASAGGSYDWLIQASSNAGGSSPSTCSGQYSVTVDPGSGSGGTTQISNVAVSNITSSSATISWDTSDPNSSIVYYGTTSGYGSDSGEDSALALSHSVTLNSLSAAQTYHFQVAGHDGSSNFTSSNDNTFITSAAPAGGGGGGSGGGSGGGGTIILPPKTTIPKGSAKNIIPPAIKVDSKLSGAYKTPPVINGSATDNQQVTKVEFSTDGGKNWLPADNVKGLGTNSVTFNTNLPPLLDGNYQLVVRAIDNDGATAVSGSQVLVIDLLPPLISAISSSIGSQPINPDNQGVIQAVENMDQRIIAGAQGGPTSITINAISTSGQAESYNFGLSLSKDDGLWQGVISFHSPGIYNLSVKAVDGANNITLRSLGQVSVAANGRLLGKDSKPLAGAKLSVFYKDQETGTWVAWDGASYDQASQLYTTSKGGYSLFLPFGTYYIQAQAKGYGTLTTRSFNITSPTVISSDLHMGPERGINIAGHRLSLPWYHSANAVIAIQKSKTATNHLAGSKVIPNFNLPQTNGHQLSAVDLLGKPTVVTFLTTWSLASQEQLPLLSGSGGVNFNWVVVGSGESLSHWTNYVRVAGYDTPITVDTSSQLAQVFKIGSVPSHYFYDRHGNLYDMKVGVLSAKEVINNLKN